MKYIRTQTRKQFEDHPEWQKGYVFESEHYHGVGSSVPEEYEPGLFRFHVVGSSVPEEYEPGLFRFHDVNYVEPFVEGENKMSNSKYIVVKPDVNGNKYIAIDKYSGGYPYTVDDPWRAELFKDVDEAVRYSEFDRDTKYKIYQVSLDWKHVDVVQHKQDAYERELAELKEKYGITD